MEHKTHICNGALFTLERIEGNEIYLRCNKDDVSAATFPTIVSHVLMNAEIHNIVESLTTKDDSSGLFVVIEITEEFMTYSPSARSVVGNMIKTIVADTRQCTICRAEAMANHPSQGVMAVL